MAYRLFVAILVMSYVFFDVKEAFSLSLRTKSEKITAVHIDNGEKSKPIISFFLLLGQEIIQNRYKCLGVIKLLIISLYDLYLPEPTFCLTVVFNGCDGAIIENAASA